MPQEDTFQQGFMHTIRLILYKLKIDWGKWKNEKCTFSLMWIAELNINVMSLESILKCNKMFCEV